MKKIAEGFTSDIYEIDAKKVLKLHKPPFSAIANIEYTKMLHVAGCGVNIPALYEQTFVGDRHGYIMEKIRSFGFSMCRNQQISVTTIFTLTISLIEGIFISSLIGMAHSPVIR